MISLLCASCGEPARWVLAGGHLPPYMIHVSPTKHRACVAGTKEALADANPEAVLLDTLDSALIGMAAQQYRPALAVYDYTRLVAHFRGEGMDEDEALEWVSFNVEGLWAGDHTPLILHRPGPG